MYKSIQALLDSAAQQGLCLHEVVIADEARLRDKAALDIYEVLEERYDVMQKSASGALDAPLDMVGGLIKGQSSTQWQRGGLLAGPFLNAVMARALSGAEVNASMGLVCAAPTAGACGILPAVLIETSKLLEKTKKDTLDALAVAGAVGAVITRNATVSGAEGGCQAECGTAAAMAAAAAVYLAGGTPEMCGQAVSIALMNCMGLICDPVASLVQLPCSYRNASQAVNAVISADMALAGQLAGIPPDEVIEAMYRTGRQLPAALRETSLGGIAATPTARAIQKQLQTE